MTTCAIYRLDEVATIERDAIMPRDIRGGTTYVGMEHINSDGQFIGVNGVEEGELASSKFRFGPEHILFGKLRPYLTKTARPDFHGICSTDIVPILPGPRIDRNYLFHFLRHPKTVEQAVLRCAGANLPRLSPRDLSAFKVPVPSLPEQCRLASILDKADSIRRKRKEAVALTEVLGRSVFLEMFGDSHRNPRGWELRAVEEVCQVAGGLQVTSARAGNPIVLPYLRVANVFRDRLDLREVKEIRVTKDESKRAMLQAGDVLVVEGHGNPDELGRAAVWNEEIPLCTHQNHLIRVRADLRYVHPIFLSAFLNSSAGRAQMLTLGKTTSGLNTISTNNIRSVRVFVPPSDLQNRFAQVIRKTRDLGSRIGGTSEHDNALFESLLHQTFDRHGDRKEIT